MHLTSVARSALLAAAWLAAAGGARAQFQLASGDIPSGSPANDSRTENVDFADVDLDGDWDAAFADGGDGGNDQNRLWINQGFAQSGTLGVFVDRTVPQLPAVADTSRDVEFADIDGDGDPDLHVSNTSTIVVQPSRWWVNQGGAQGGTAGYYVDDTAARWVGLSDPECSVPTASVLPGGGFRDWCCDSDFGDLDNDGDLDLVHSSYGQVFSGLVPTRIFLNDGNGYFSEFNPSGFKLPGNNIQNGDRGLWCEGEQQHDTTSTDGTYCDIASSALDVDLGDVDGDFDLDILHGSRQTAPRMFRNRLEETGGHLAFRDVTSSTFPPGYTSGTGHYEQEMGDLDGDGDLDILGLNWLHTGGNFWDVTLRNGGAGVFFNPQILAGSASDDNEVDFLDYDNDGDLDLYVTNFSGQDRLYRNDWNGVPGGGGDYSFSDVTASLLPPLTSTGLDTDACDVDGDGDTDLFVANNFGQPNQYVQNLSGVADTHAPYVPNVEQAPDRIASATPTVVRAHVYDNAPYYVTWYTDTLLKVWVDGIPQPDVPMRSSGGQVFRGAIPGGLVGAVTYRVVSADEYGNTGASAIQGYTAGSLIGTADCFGTTCPCGNDDPSAGCATSTGSGALLTAFGSTSASADDAVLLATGVPPFNQGLCYMGDALVSNAFFDGKQCALGNTFRFLSSIQGSGPSGTMEFTGMAAASGLITPGSTWHFQFWFRDFPGSPCGTGANLSNSLGITYTP